MVPLGLLAAGSWWLHQRVLGYGHIPPTAVAVWLGSAAIVVAQLLLSWFSRPYRCPPPALRATVIVPCYNEDPAYLARVLESLRWQTRQADKVVVVDDGSRVSYAGFPGAYPEVEWIRQDNQGKKHAQVAGFAADPDADVYVTIDSDSALAPDALEEILRPFADDRVAGVAGLEWAGNIDVNLLTRAIGARSVAFQLFAMASQSAARGNVLIAPGAFSAFRGEVMREGADAYTGETFCGMPVRLGDDTLLTLQALMRGWVVQQVTAVAFPAYPEKVSHHLRQWTRWMRASTIRQIWRLRYLPISSYGWWFSVWQLGAFTAGIAATALLIAGWPATVPLLYGAAVGVVAWPLILACRLPCVSRSDQGFWSRLYGVALMPAAGVWYLAVLRWIRFWGIGTLARQGWVTREKKVEVTLR